MNQGESAEPFKPDWRVHPGELLREIIEDHKLTQRITATALGVRPQYLNDICQGRRRINPEMATRLAGVFGPSARFWIRLQALYDEPL